MLYADNPFSDQSIEKVLSILPGQNFKDITKSLFKAGLVKDPIKFNVLGRIKKADTRIKAGKYRLFTDMTPNQLIDDLVLVVRK